MSKVVKLQGDHIRFPQVCVVCQAPAGDNLYTISLSKSYGSRTETMNLKVPMCDRHYEMANSKNKREKLAGTIGLIAGIVVGLIVTVGLLAYWSGSQQGSPALNIPAAIFVGISFFVVVWVVMLFFIAPVFADPEVKKARRAAQIKAFWKNQDLVELELDNERVADLIARANPGE